MMELKITQLSQNSGQITGLPANPRQWKKADVERLAKSIEETPELLDARPLIVMPHDGKYIVLGGNLRLAALKHLGRKAAPVYVLPDDTPIDKQKEIVIKDNGSFGEWDFDMLANEWDDLPLANWGVPAWNPEEEMGDDEDKEYSRKIEAPIYEPREGVATLDGCLDKKRYEAMLEEIDKAEIRESEKDFLRLAASRHIVFNYDKIADYYANATPEVQKLMERSALVIVDFGKAIEEGFIKMSEQLRQEYIKENL